MKRFVVFVSLIAGMLVSAAARGQTPMGTAFTYQGQIEDASGPITDTCDFEFSLWDAESGGLEVGTSPQPAPGTGVDDGLFTVTLDFGDGAFNGEARWLELEVCCPAGSCGLETLTPRQKLTPAPHALALPGLSTQQTASSHNLIGGYTGNSVDAAVEAGTVGGGGVPGFPNRVFDSSGTIGGGDNNTAGSDDGNPATATNATVCGGGENTATAHFASAGGGWLNNATGEMSVVSGGQANTASGYRAALGGGFTNTASGTDATIGGGNTNIASETYATVSGGTLNTASGVSASVGGGESNAADGQKATVGGGQSNTASGYVSTVAGGLSNTASSDGATVSGGMFNTASGGTSVIGGGVSNTTTGANATVPGGESNTASAFSFAAGTRAQANHTGTFVWSDITTPEGSFFESTGDNQFLIRADGGVGVNTNNPLSSLHIGDTGRPGWDGIMFPDATVQTTAYTGAPGGGYWSPSGTDIYNSNTGNVGIGTTSPQAKLEVAGGILRIDYSHVNDQTPSVYVRNFNDTYAYSPNDEDTLGIWAGVSSDSSEIKVGLSARAAGLAGTCIGVSANAFSLADTSYGVYASAFDYGVYASGQYGGFFDGKGYFSGDVSIGTSSASPDVYPERKLEVVSSTTFGADHAEDGAAAIFGHLSTTSEAVNNGVLGRSDSPWGNGVTGYASSTTGDAWGVLGISASDGGVGVAGLSRRSPGWGVYGIATGEGRGVFGEGVDGVGVSGWVSGETGFNIGVRGASASPDGYGGYFLGRSYFSGNVGVGPGASMPAEALDVDGNIHASGTITSGSSITIDGTPGAEKITSSGDLELHATITGVPVRVLRVEATGHSAPNLIAGGDLNDVTDGVIGVTISGGGLNDGLEHPNLVTDSFGTIGGGYGNRAGDDAGTVSDHQLATVGGGRYNIASGSRSTIAGGSANFASHDYSSVGGGSTNYATGSYATSPGGRDNVAGRDYSFAAGRQAKANHVGSFVWGDSLAQDCNSAASDSFNVCADGGVRLSVNNGQSVTIGDDGVDLIATSTGAHLTVFGVWSNASDEALKENFAPVGSRTVLDKVASLPVRTWNYRGEKEGVRHMGPTAQDFAAAFGLGDSDRSIGTVDTDGVALAAIQGLYEVVKEKEAEIAALEARLVTLEKLVKHAGADWKGGVR